MGAINLTVAFLLELSMLAAFAYWGFQAGGTLPVKIALAAGAPLLAAIIWSILLAPRASHRLTGLPYLLLKNGLFALAALGLAAAGAVTLALLFVVVAVINQVFLLGMRQET